MISSAENEVKAIVLDKLRKRGCWGGRYTPLDSLVGWIGKKVKRNGRKVRAAIKQLVNEGYLILHKRGKTVSLNPTRSREITKLIEERR
ncbi:TPA: hypothetical protein EYP70_02515 [Candidatus Bathyarchaeota archaeon]|nr:hypothetical protein [Candidatus Bathyarchaeota archaeon]